MLKNIICNIQNWINTGYREIISYIMKYVYNKYICVKCKTCYINFIEI